VLGLHFGPSDFSVSAQLETCRCLTAAWTSSTTVQCANANGLQSTIAEVGSRGYKLQSFQLRRTDVVGRIPKCTVYGKSVGNGHRVELRLGRLHC
jgi:hypothetical protein